jgi:hypothetical protein
VRRFNLALSIAAVCALASPSRATRIVLAPGGLVANPSSVAVEYAGRATAARDWLGWVRIGVPQSDLGVEVELERYELRGERGTSLSAQYSITGNAFSDIAPAISVGVRDLLDEGREHRAIYLAMTKTIGLSRNQERLAQNVKLHLGVGDSRLDGVFGGLTVRLTCGPEVGAEYVRRTANASVAVRVMRYGDVRVYTLDGHMFLGGRLGYGW